MQFRAKIVAFSVVLACGVVLCAALILFLARGIDTGMRSVTMAEDQLALYLTMESKVSDLLWLHVTAAAVPSAQTMGRVSATYQEVREEVQKIRVIVTEEEAFRDEDQLEELQRLDDIEAALDEIEEAFASTDPRTLSTQTFDALAGPLSTVVSVLDEKIAPLVDIAIADETIEVIEARNYIAGLSRRSVQMGTTAGVLTLLLAAGGVVVLLKAFMRPFASLLEGAARLARGNLSYRISEDSRDEFGRLSRDFNIMAEQLERSDLALRAEEEELQKRVAARTMELEDANVRLSKQDETRRRFLADVSHELRTPLTVMRGEAEVALRLGNSADGMDVHDALAGVVEQSEHMSRLVDDLLFVARREAGETPLALCNVELGAVLRRSISDATQLATDARILLDGDETTLATRIHVDPGRIHQLLMVLFDNALRYSPDNPEIRVNAHTATDGINVSVQDCGIGIPSDELPHIFDRFVRGSNAIPGGTGLGLPVAKAIATAHGGTLSIASHEGEGTTVTLLLPALSTGDPI